MDPLELPDEDVRVLVHIVSHQDIVFDITPAQAKGGDAAGRPAASEPRGHLFAKPKFHRFNLATKKAYWHMTPEPQAAAPGAAAGAFPFRERMFSDPERPDLGQWPLGLDLSEPLDFASRVRFPWSASRDVEMGWEDFSWNNPAPGGASSASAPADEDAAEAGASPAAVAPPGLALPAGSQSSPRARAILFPLVATLLPLWRLAVQRATSKSAGRTRYVLLLVSGSGRRRDDTSVQDNSTRYTARLIRRFVSHAFRDVEVFVAHSHHDVYRFEQNVRFLRSVQTAIRSLRHRVVLRHGSDWAKHFGVSVTLGGGTPARVAAATASLRVFSPQMLHMVELKRLWFLDQLRFADVDHRSFEAGEAQFEAAAEALPGPLRMLVREMRAHCRAFEAVRDSGDGDARGLGGSAVSGEPWGPAATPSAGGAASQPMHGLADFWMRKSKKPVLAVLLVRWPESLRARHGLPELETFRGINLEVSLPTGSLCSERAAIAAAVAQRPFLRREHCVAIAVLSASLVPASHWSRGAAAAAGAATAAATAVSGPASPGAPTAGTPRAPEPSSPAGRARGSGWPSKCGCASSACASPDKRQPGSNGAPFDGRRLLHAGASQGEVSHGIELELAGQMPDQAEVGSCLGFVEAPFGCCYDDVFEALAQEGGTVLRRRGGRDAARRAGAKAAASLHPGPPATADGCDGCADEACCDTHAGAGPGSEELQASGTDALGALPGFGRPFPLGSPGSPQRAMSLSPSCEMSELPDDSAEAAKARSRGLGAGVAASDVVSNPLPPCGSCSEWLKKINEVQPDFRVLMFRDTSCTTAIVRSVE